MDRLTLLARLGAVFYASVLTLLALLHALAPQRDGLLALTQVLAPHIHLPLLVAVPLVVFAGERYSRAAIILAAVIGLLRFGPGMLPLHIEEATPAVELPVMTWNLGVGERSRELLVQKLLATDAQVVALQELRQEHVGSLDAEPLLADQFPYRVMRPHAGTLGMGLLSAHPIELLYSTQSPPVISVTLEVNSGPDVHIVNAHASAPNITVVSPLRLPVGYETVARDRSLVAIREIAQPTIDLGEPLVLLGDLNVTDREVAYGEVSRGLTDAHLAAGWGPGSTWRPLKLAFLPLAVLRIDYVLLGGPARAISAAVECVPDGDDHCVVSADIALLAEPPDG